MAVEQYRQIGRRRSGFTLVELVVAIVALAALGAAIAAVFVQGVAGSADPQLRAQARAIAEGYVEEIMLKAYSDPEGDTAVEPRRELYDDACDYNAIGSEAPTDQRGQAMGDGALNDYTVTVSVGDGSSTSACGSGGLARISVVVSHVSDRVNYELVSQRADY
jgi:MSHA pilin protein MshD